MEIYQTVESALEAEARGEKGYSLFLANKNLSLIPESIGELKNLQTLNLGHNPSLDWDATFKLLQKLPNLQTLYLGVNQLTSLPESISKLKNLQTLGLRNNELTFLPASIDELKKLQWLDLEDNNFSTSEKESIKKLLPNTEIVF